MLSLLITSSRAELIWAGLTVSSSQQWMSGLPVPVPGQAAAGEAPEVVDAPIIYHFICYFIYHLIYHMNQVVDEPAELPAVVELWLAALVEVLDPGDGVEGAGHVQVPVADVVRPSLDHL